MDNKETKITEDNVCKLLLSTVKKLVNITSKKLPNDVNVDRVKQLLKLDVVLDDDLIMKMIAPSIIKYRKLILDKNESLFLDDKFGEDFLSKNDTDNLVKDLFKNIKKMLKELNDSEKSVIWNEITSILNFVLHYIKFHPDFKYDISK